MRNLAGKVALISGVARGQGRSHAIRLANEGVAIIGFDALADYDTVPYSQATWDDLRKTVELVEKAGGRILVEQADVRRREQVATVVEHGLTEFGHIDIVLANAGIGTNGAPFWKIPESAWRDVIDVCLTGAWNTVSAAVHSMIDAGSGGSIVLISSGAGLKGAPNVAPYTAAKTGMIGLMRTMANDLAPYGIRVNTVCPTNVSTDLLLNQRVFSLFRPDLEHPTAEDVKPVMAHMHPLGEPWVEPEDVSAAVAFLASDEARWITGIVLPVDLGLSNKW